ncbi:hypothetical protein MHYP_G00060770 [Metynnis hypsauchen]
MPSGHCTDSRKEAKCRLWVFSQPLSNPHTTTPMILWTQMPRTLPIKNHYPDLSHLTADLLSPVSHYSCV